MYRMIKKPYHVDVFDCDMEYRNLIFLFVAWLDIQVIKGTLLEAESLFVCFI